MVYKLVISTLEDMMQMLYTKKMESDDDTEKRHIAVAYTDLEKIKSYIQTYLVKESES